MTSNGVAVAMLNLLPLILGVAGLLAVIAWPDSASRQRIGIAIGALVVMSSACTVGVDHLSSLAHGTAGLRLMPPPTRPASRTGSGPVQQLPHVFVIVLENRSYADALATPYVAQLAQTYALATN
jgi:hypothetical protein